jgi:Cytochrome C oxidase, cbb3-type, subunit III
MAQTDKMEKLIPEAAKTDEPAREEVRKRRGHWLVLLWGRRARNRWRQRSATSPIGLVFIAALSAGPAVGQDAANGQEIYFRYCASCHGASANGDGPTAAVLTIRPPDLTKLAVTNDGVFPTKRVVMRIDGREPLISHGSSMPAFGGVFEGRYATMRAPDGMPILTSKSVVDVVVWLESIQE